MHLISLATLLLASWSLRNLLPFGSRNPRVLSHWVGEEDIIVRVLLKPHIFKLGEQLNCREAVGKRLMKRIESELRKTEQFIADWDTNMSAFLLLLL